MSILDKVRAIEFDRNKSHLYGIKSAVIWGFSKTSNYSFPLIYISKPKSITEEEFNEILDHLEVNIVKNKSV